MSATADKARYFLEQSVPELKELEKKKLLSPEEITAIAKKRSDFEHKINARGSSPSDYARYAEFEINVDALRKKRMKRLAVKTTTHNGQRRVFFVFDRGTRKFPGDVGLWMQSIEYARKQKAYKKLAQIFTNVLRLHPTKSELWIYAAQFATEEHGDMTEARSYMQRGLRFCKNSISMWLEYARLEMAYIAKIYARRQILGIGEEAEKKRKQQISREDDEDVMQLPKLTAEDINPEMSNKHDTDEVALQNLDNTPAMSGAIPIAIFDAAMVQFKYDAEIGHQFFEILADFGNIPAANRILNHILEVLHEHAASDWHTHACDISIPLAGQAIDDPNFPSALRLSLKRISTALAEAKISQEFTTWCRNWLQSQIKDGLDPALKTVLSSKIQSLK